MKVSRLKGKALDWVVAKCEELTWLYEDLHKPPPPGAAFSTDWSLAGPIIDRERITLTTTHIPGSDWTACQAAPELLLRHTHVHKSPLVAAMRCYVASKFGDEIHVPEELK